MAAAKQSVANPLALQHGSLSLQCGKIARALAVDA
jgi:hypothetical protein